MAFRETLLKYGIDERKTIPIRSLTNRCLTRWIDLSHQEEGALFWKV
jgi:hypothetical protein